MLQRVPVRGLWRILREADLGAIRRAAESRFEVIAAADDRADADWLARGLAGGTHPWLVTVDPSSAASATACESFNLVVLVSRQSELSPFLRSIRDDAAARRVPLVVAVIEPSETAGVASRVAIMPGAAPIPGAATMPGTVALPRRGESQRVVIRDLDANGLTAVGQALLAATPPELRLALGRQFQGLRELAFTSLIDETARANASYAFTTGIAEVVPLLNVPMNIGDIVMLTKNQLVMSYKIALVAGKSGSPRHLIAEILGVLGGGLLFRQIARQLVGLIPVVGVVAKVTVAYAGTWAIGRAVVLWATVGETVTAETVRVLYDEGLTLGRQAASALVSHRRDS
jgi:uncharacterized protein (DUF697 family)